MNADRSRISPTLYSGVAVNVTSSACQPAGHRIAQGIDENQERESPLAPAITLPRRASEK